MDPERAQRAAAQADAGDRAEAAQLMAAANVDEARAAAAKEAAEGEQRPEPEPLRPGQDRPDSPAQGQEWTIEDQDRQAAEGKARAEHVAADADRAAHRQQAREAEHEERKAAVDEPEANVDQSDTLDVTAAEADVEEPTQEEAPSTEKAQDGAAAESQDRADELRKDAANSYDSAERREATAHELESRGLDHELVATRMRADVSQGRPATEAVKPAARPAKARKGRLRGLMGGRQRNLGR